MCGIAGIIGPNAPRNVVKDIFTRLLVHTQVRGTDATGVAATQADGSPVLMFKRDINASEFVKTPEYKQLIDEYTGGALIGHCRKTTKGSEKQNDNNHPIVSDRTGITVIHNGTVSDAPWRVVGDNGENPYMLDKFTAEVDTEAIVRLVDTMWHIPREEDGNVVPEVVAATPKDRWTKNVSLDRAIRDMVYNMSGGMSCALLNPSEPNTVRLWRTTNPCHIAYVPEYEMIVFASTSDILQKSLVSYQGEIVLGFFDYTENVFPEYYHKETPANQLITINHDADHENPFSFQSWDLAPSAASTLRTSIERGKSVTVNTNGVQVN